LARAGPREGGRDGGAGEGGSSWRIWRLEAADDEGVPGDVCARCIEWPNAEADGLRRGQNRSAGGPRVLGKIGSLPLKDRMFGDIPLKDLILAVYH